jgi:hypothetical protein
MDPHPPGTRFFHRLLDVSGHGSQSSFPTESEVSVVEATPFASARHVGVVLADDEACNTLFFDEGTCNTLFFDEENVCSSQLRQSPTAS